MPTTDHFNLNLKGYSEIKQLIKELPEAVGTQVQRDINAKAARVAVNEMRRASPSGTASKNSRGKLENGVIAKKAKTNDPTAFWVGLKKKFFYGVLLSTGTKNRTTKGYGKYKKPANRGAIQATHWIDKAHDKAAPKIIDFLSTNYLKLVNNSIKKQLRNLLK